MLVFGSDHIYKMDVAQMVEYHRAMGADLTVATLRVPRSEARAFGCLHVDASGWVRGFVEKPEDPPAIPGDPDHTLVSMGNYVFRTGTMLAELRRNAELEDDHATTSAATSSPHAHERVKVAAYDFMTQLCPGRERARARLLARRRHDRRVLRGQHGPRLGAPAPQPLQRHVADPRRALAAAVPASSCSPTRRSSASARRSTRSSAPARSSRAARSSAASCFNNVRVNSFASVADSILFPGVDVGRSARLRRCIVDKGVRVPAGAVIGEDPEADRERFTVSEGGVVVVTRQDFGQRDEFDVD